jgi:hypothetical protein
MNEFANVKEPSPSFDAIVCRQAGLEWISMDDVGRYNFRPRYNFNVTEALVGGSDASIYRVDGPSEPGLHPDRP